jgi:hypothetical protein
LLKRLNVGIIVSEIKKRDKNMSKKPETRKLIDIPVGELTTKQILTLQGYVTIGMLSIIVILIVIQIITG